MHDFQIDLKWSNDPSHREFWLAVYGLAFPGYTVSKPIEDMALQRAGIDRMLYGPSGDVVYTEEKKRRRGSLVYLETRHEMKTGAPNKPGWMNKSLECDWLAYAFFDRSQVWLWRWRDLQAVWLARREFWLSQLGEKSQVNRDYVSYCIAIAPEVIHDELPNAARLFIQV